MKKIDYSLYRNLTYAELIHKFYPNDYFTIEEWIKEITIHDNQRAFYRMFLLDDDYTANVLEYDDSFSDCILVKYFYSKEEYQKKCEFFKTERNSIKPLNFSFDNYKNVIKMEGNYWLLFNLNNGAYNREDFSMYGDIDHRDYLKKFNLYNFSQKMLECLAYDKLDVDNLDNKDYKYTKKENLIDIYVNIDGKPFSYLDRINFFPEERMITREFCNSRWFPVNAEIYLFNSKEEVLKAKNEYLKQKNPFAYIPKSDKRIIVTDVMMPLPKKNIFDN